MNLKCITALWHVLMHMTADRELTEENLCPVELFSVTEEWSVSEHWRRHAWNVYILPLPPSISAKSLGFTESITETKVLNLLLSPHPFTTWSSLLDRDHSVRKAFNTWSLSNPLQRQTSPDSSPHLIYPVEHVMKVCLTFEGVRWKSQLHLSQSFLHRRALGLFSAAIFTTSLIM